MVKRDIIIILIAIVLGLASRMIPSLYADWSFLHQARIQNELAIAAQQQRAQQEKK
jgi:uncharacterized membrane protein (DUF106 family)